MTKPTTIDAYIAGFPADVQAVLQHLRAIIRKAAPKAEEGISYAIPVFKMNGTYVIYFAGYKRHVSLYPIPKGDAALRKELAPYEAGKGTLRFSLDDRLPVGLITRVAKAGLKENAERTKAKGASKKKATAKKA